ncbi:CHAT domain-containing protein [Streptomyces coeruleorubidus]|uniref:CHAT domain-containing protein n=1 Tax=Streptomyces coeruleorubidus TaxID=116188 RepID=A0ABZ0KRR0_STRC4|nr:CHAT domain-containing protein [Streptomyces coeruleorubidus]WOT40554.1 CHAT domain-containing protein [Streptomyces coeruleorubidus]WOT40750.1 CHAT domain-containing protein [Streptomyces coeruleorubidus]
MPSEMASWTRQNPSRDYRDLHVEKLPDLILALDIVSGNSLRARMSGAAADGLYSANYGVVLNASSTIMRARAAQVCKLWDEAFVGFTSYDDSGDLVEGRPANPYAAQTDLREEPESEFVTSLQTLAFSGERLLFGTLFGGEQDEIALFREDLAQILARDNLRIRFDSELFLPWPMMCLRPADLPGLSQDTPDELFQRFLGHRHRIEQTGDAHPTTAAPTTLTACPRVSLNQDLRIDMEGRTAKNKVVDALKDGTEYRGRTHRHEFLQALADPGFSEHLTYFWCHGSFERDGPEAPYLVIRLTDNIAIHAGDVHDRRDDMGTDTPFQPFIILNACHASAGGGEADRAHLGRAFILSGARGVLGPQIGMPQVFAAEYAHRFISRYLRSDETAGEIALALARYFADQLRNPLGIAYSLHCGMDTRLTRARVTASGHEQEIAA